MRKRKRRMRKTNLEKVSKTISASLARKHQLFFRETRKSLKGLRTEQEFDFNMKNFGQQ